nr:MAG TPA: hypothetical protein [Caudoviricetes sp.]
MSRKSCEDCIYYRSISDTYPTSMKVCHYMLDTGKQRNSPPESCTKKVKIKEKLKRRKRKCAR